MHSTARILWRLGGLGVILIAGGCGVERHEISGTVTFAGKPVPTGSVQFVPNKSRGNAGPTASADITNGQFRILAKDGVVGGPYHVTIFGYDGATTTVGTTVNHVGKPLFRTYRTTIDLPQAPSTHDLVVPPEK